MKRIAMVGNYLPRKCGIATFTSDLSESLAAQFPDITFFAVPVNDTETGYKFFRRDALLPLLDGIDDGGWSWDTEFMAHAHRHGLRVVEIPGAYVRRPEKRSTVHGVRDSLRYFRQLIRFRLKLRHDAREAAAAPGASRT